MAGTGGEVVQSVPVHRLKMVDGGDDMPCRQMLKVDWPYLGLVRVNRLQLEHGDTNGLT